MNCLALCQKIADILSANGVKTELFPDFRENIYFPISGLTSGQLAKLKQDLEDLGNKVYSFTQFNPNTQTFYGRIKVKNNEIQ